MCECIEKIKSYGVEHIFRKNYPKAEIKKVEFKENSIVIMKTTKGTELVMRTYNNLEIEHNAQKKKFNIPITHTFCPFCGEKIDKDPEELSEPTPLEP